ncbi:MAG: metallophosphoesterase [Spirosomaceae bacterium]|nr:metallophosphoesterase [Spirosomataceae bacterium]
MNSIVRFLLFAVVFILIDIYVWQAIRLVIKGSSINVQRITSYVFWGITAISIAIMFIGFVMQPPAVTYKMRTVMAAIVFIVYISKLIVVLFMFVDEIIRLFKWVISLFQSPETQPITTNQTLEPAVESNKITRSEFLTKTALAVGGLNLGAMSWGIISGAHDYRIHRVTVRLKNLKQFDGIRIAQLSDIHSGSFFNKTAVKGGVEMLLAEKPDLVFFTGDLVNNEAGEVKDYINIFDKVKAPLGVFSTLGNHDYGDYIQWESAQKKAQNLQDLIKSHKIMGWDILAKYGNLEKTMQGTDEYPVKLLLSHDPSHWRNQVLGKTDIDVAFAGHTHGMQYGVEIGDFKWSPVQFRYKEWAGLYSEGNQNLYVNRGFGYIGYPGRVGILPEITIMELKSA